MGDKGHEEKEKGLEGLAALSAGRSVRHRRNRLRGHNHVFCMAAVEWMAVIFSNWQRMKSPRRQGIALEAVSAVSGLPLRNIGTDGVNTSGNLVSGNARIRKSRPAPFFHQRVAMTNAT